MNKPLAHMVRPESIEEIIGQEHLLGKNKALSSMVENKHIQSMIFFGPPGTGKTTSAIAIAKSLNKPYRLFNAVSDNKKKLDQLLAEAELSNGLVMIVDEVHRMNKGIQDVLLPHLESGLITMIGATTANPYFSINPAIRSRVHLFEFLPLSEDDLFNLLKNAKDNVSDKIVDEDIFKQIATQSNGDARFALNALDLLLYATTDNEIKKEHLKNLNLSLNISIDKDSDNYHDTLSGFQKSIRGSDVNAALYYLAKLIEVGDLDSIERRLLVIAYEDVGLANPALCARVVNACDAARKVGFPEARIILSHAVIECALSPKSKSAEYAIDSALNAIRYQTYHTPKYLRLNAVGVDEKDMYDYDNPDSWFRIQYLPDGLEDIEFYEPYNLDSAEKTYANNYAALKKIKRTNILRSLRKK